jgi:hypothetical protein
MSSVRLKANEYTWIYTTQKREQRSALANQTRNSSDDTYPRVVMHSAKSTTPWACEFGAPILLAMWLWRSVFGQQAPRRFRG